MGVSDVRKAAGTFVTGEIVFFCLHRNDRNPFAVLVHAVALA
jgi:hypothetical protein